MATIAKLNAQLTGDGTSFRSTMERAAEVTEKFSSRVNAALGKTLTPLEKYNRTVEQLKAQLKSGKINYDQFSKGIEGAAKRFESQQGMLTLLTRMKGGALAVGAAFVAAGVAMSAFVIKQGLAAAQMHVTARAIGLQANDIYALERALLEVSADTTRAADIYLNLTRTIYAASTGNLLLADSFRRLGLDARKLVTLRTPDALRDIADAIARLPTVTERAALAFSVFGDDAAAMLPILSQGSKAIEDAMRKELAAGKGIDPERAAQWEQWARNADKFQRAITGVGMAIGNGLIPFLNAMLEKMPKSEKVAAGINQAIKSVLSNTAAISKHVDAAYNSFKIFGEGIRVILYTVIGLLLELVKWCIKVEIAMERVIQGALETGSLLPGQAGRGFRREADDVARSIATWNAEVEDLSRQQVAAQEAIQQSVGGIRSAWDSLGQSSASDWVKDLIKKADEFGATLNRIAGAGGGVAELAKRMELLRKGAEVFNETRTPLEKFNSQLAELDEMLKAKAITWDTYARAVAGAVNELEQANQLTKMGLAAGVRAGTTEAYSAIVTSRQQDSLIHKETAEQRAQRIREQSLKVQEQQREYNKRTAEAVEGLRVATF